MAQYRAFLQSPSLEDLDKFKREDLFAIAKELDLDVRKSMRKADLKRSIVEILVDDDLLPEDVLDELSPHGVSEASR